MPITEKSEPGSSGKQLKDLVVSRSSIKGQITKFKNYLTSVNSKEELSAIELAELSLKLSKLETLSVKFDNLQNNIEVLNSSNINVEIDERDSVETDIIICIATAKTLMEKYDRRELQQRRESLALENPCLHDHQEVGFKLPQIQITKFDGSYFRWLEFKDTFESLVHNNSRIKPIHKFHYLISYLEGDAARIISNLEVSAANYVEAWKLLSDRYNNKRLLINHHLSSLFNVHPLTGESDRSLRFLVDHVTKNLRALSSLGQPTDKWDTLIIYMLCTKLDSNTLVKWEEYRNTLDDDVPSLDKFQKFLTDRADVIESLHRNKQNSFQPKPTASFSQQNNKFNNRSHSHNVHNKSSFKTSSSFTKAFASVDQSRQSYICVICNENHKIYDCPSFKSKGLKERLVDVANYKLCTNCLRQGHPVNQCRMGPCRECKKKHNSLLHPTNADDSTNATTSNAASVVQFAENNRNKYQILLSTALVEVMNPSTKDKLKIRAMLDCGSQSTFITKSLKDKLSLKSNKIGSLKVIGIGNICTNNVLELCNVQLNSINSDFSAKLSCLVLEEITGELPKSPINLNIMSLPKNLLLADPNFHQPAPIDMLIGADIFWDILGTEQRYLGPELPKLQSSKLGWLVSGPIKANINTSRNTIQCNHVSLANKLQDPIDNLLTKFWELEEVPETKILSKTEKMCEEHFQSNLSRLKTGRFVVRLPLTQSPDTLGDTYYLAKRRFLNLEKKFKRNPNLKIEYSNFIREYADLGHLSESSIAIPKFAYFLCHHPVFKPNSESTALRVVFDGSAPSSSGVSLNDILMVGPNVQDSLFSILVRARQYKYILTGDIEKMYRQILVHDDDRKLQLILWREDESQPIKTLQLNTLTYGTASASYLSTRCLQQVGEELDDELIKTIIKHDFYVDDLITGSNDERELSVIQTSISKALKSSGFNLRKFKTNSTKLFQNTNLNTKESLTLSESTSTLGLGWSPSNDCFNFLIKSVDQNQQNKQNNKITKRTIMSSSFKTFDPLGLLSPVIVQSKMMLQKLWQQKLDWDHAIPQEIEQEWTKYANNLLLIKDIQVDRRVLSDNPKVIELHSFSDASESAFGACIYVKSVSASGDVTVKLLCAKSKVAPLKPTTIPRLELCAALLAAKLCRAVTNSLRYQADRLVHWCDSSVVLAWITNDLRKLKTFAANRTNEICKLTDPAAWRYVPTAHNPADLISRGVDAGRLISSNLWWSGPDFLQKGEHEWPTLNINLNINSLPEIKSLSTATCEDIINFEKYSKLNTLQRCFAYVKRFIFNLINPNNKRSGSLTTDELKDSFHGLCAIAQRQSYPAEYELLIKNKSLSSKSKILSLSPFMDKSYLIRVGGRINASNYSYDKRHPILLHSSHHLTKLYFEKEHLRLLHAGPQLLLASVREAVWPVSGRHLARRTVNKCVCCRRLSGKTLCPKMGNLPSQRVNPDFPFLSVGLDFAGPFQILNRKGRGAALVKCYLCLFICLRYKCIHLEAVSDLSKDAFIMTLRRFISRRGKPAEIFCDNGRNFVATAKEVGKFIRQVGDPLCDTMNQEGIKFLFTPTYAPHFGGIWESGIKSAKYHIKRVMGNSHLTFEEISTLFSQVEAILNSRPLYPLSSSPDDLLSLTPGHFLIGRPLTALPSPALENRNERDLRRYARIERLHQHFWRRWQKEYVAELQQRTKWRVNHAKLTVGDLVLIHEDNAPPLSWRLGRVVRLFPGPDGVSRVADVNTIRGCVRRPLTRLCPLPSDEDFQC